MCDVLYNAIVRRGFAPRLVQYSTVQDGTVQYSTVQYSTVQYSTVQYTQWLRASFSTVRSVASRLHYLVALRILFPCIVL